MSAGGRNLGEIGWVDLTVRDAGRHACIAPAREADARRGGGGPGGKHVEVVVVCCLPKSCPRFPDGFSRKHARPGQLVRVTTSAADERDRRLLALDDVVNFEHFWLTGVDAELGENRHEACSERVELFL